MIFPTRRSAIPSRYAVAIYIQVRVCYFTCKLEKLAHKKSILEASLPMLL